MLAIRRNQEENHKRRLFRKVLKSKKDRNRKAEVKYKIKNHQILINKQASTQNKSSNPKANKNQKINRLLKILNKQK